MLILFDVFSLWPGEQISPRGQGGRAARKTQEEGGPSPEPPPRGAAHVSAEPAGPGLSLGSQPSAPPLGHTVVAPSPGAWQQPGENTDSVHLGRIRRERCHFQGPDQLPTLWEAESRHEGEKPQEICGRQSQRSTANAGATYASSSTGSCLAIRERLRAGTHCESCCYKPHCSVRTSAFKCKG